MGLPVYNRSFRRFFWSSFVKIWSFWFPQTISSPVWENFNFSGFLSRQLVSSSRDLVPVDWFFSDCFLHHRRIIVPLGFCFSENLSPYRAHLFYLIPFLINTVTSSEDHLWFKFTARRSKCLFNQIPFDWFYQTKRFTNNWLYEYTENSFT